MELAQTTMETVVQPEKNEFDISKDLIRIQMTLLSLEKDYVETLQEIEQKNKEYNMADSIIEILLNDKEKVVTFDLGGKSAQTYLYKLLSFPDSVFTALAVSDYLQFKEVRSIFFFDFNNTYFDIIMTYIRTGHLICKDLLDNDRDSLYSTLEFLGLWSAAHQCINNKPLKIIGCKFSSLHSMYTLTADYTKLGIKDNINGYSTSTKQGWIIFEFDNYFKPNKIEIAPITHKLPSTQKKDSSAGTSIFISKDNINFNKIGVIPLTYGKGIVNIKINTKLTGKYLKFEHNNYINIGYLVVT